MISKNMMRGLVGLILICISFSVYSTNINLTINWQESIVVNDSLSEYRVLHFDGASYPDAGTGLPWKSIDIDQGSNVTSFSVSIVSEELEPIETGEDILLPDSFDGDRLTYVTNKVLGTNRLLISYLPLVYKEGTWNKVTKAILKYEIDNSAVRLKSSSSTGEFAENSVLSTGKWVKMKIANTGLYKLTYEDIAGLGLTPENVHIHGFGGAELDENYFKRTADDLPEVPVWVNDGGDGVFSAGDFILFYAEGPVSWNYHSSGYYTHEQNRFCSNSYYFITSNDKPINTVQEQNNVENTNDAIELSTFDDFVYFEEEEVNLIRSGQEWYGKEITPGSTTSYNVDFPNRVADNKVTLIFKGVSQSYNTAGIFDVSAAGVDFGRATISQTRISITGNEAYSSRRVYQNTLINSGDKFSVDIDYVINESSAKGWIDYLIVNAKRNLILEDAQMDFRAVDSRGKKTKYNIQTTYSNVVVLDVTNQQEITQPGLAGTVEGFSFYDESNQVKEYVAFNPDGAIPKPQIMGEVENQNLHGSGPYDYVIVTREKLKEQAERLAELHRSMDSLRVLVVTPELIYNEFSSGRPDVTAIRYFAKMLRDRYSDEEDQIKYLLLFGDGSYDNREESQKENDAFILTYESPESLNKSNTYVSDDYFGLLDNGESNGSSDVIDIGVGRLPLTTVSQAEAMVDKIESYMNMDSEEEWLNRVCFIGDDEDGNVHMRDANRLSKVIEDENPEFIMRRIFLDAYQQEIGTSGESYPGAVAEIEELLHRGVLLISYSGHGGPNGLAHERIITSAMIENWENFDRLPLFVTATCDFSPYDHDDVTSAGELVLLNPNGGGIASLTTTRLVYASQNYKLGEKFYSYLFDQKDGKPYRLGDVFCLAKQNTSTGVNGRKFALLGDPALLLKYPQKKNIEITSVNNVSGSPTDTISALDYITVKGKIKTADGQLDSTANGVLYPSLFDKEVKRHTLSNDGEEIFNFTSYDNMLYGGKTVVENGIFEYSFYAPKDINYSFGKGRLYHYFDGDDYTSHTLDTNIVIGGLTASNIEDSNGPDIEAYINSPSFTSGAVVNQQSYFVANLSDYLGINTSGIGVGHDLTLIIDDDPYQLYNLNSYFEPILGSSSEGSIAFQIPVLDEGEHKLSFKAWDIYNNSTNVELYFVVEDNVSPDIVTCKVYPNPVFSTNQEVTLDVEHNRPNDVVSYALDIIDLNGKVMFHQNGKTSSADGSLKIRYNLDNFYGNKLIQGVYFYRVLVEARGLESEMVTGKLMVVP